MKILERFKDKVITLKLQMGDSKGLLIPRGLKENVVIDIVDGFATFKFDHATICKRFAEIAIKNQTNKSDEKTMYNERTQKAITKYGQKTKEEILIIIKNQLKRMVKSQ